MAGIVPPQVQVVTTLPLIVGVREMFALSIAESPKFCAVTVMTPAAVVATEATYFDVELADSQPHPLAVIEAALPVCTVSVIEVRHDDAARINSETLAFFV